MRADAAHGEVAGAVVIRGIAALGAVAPAPEVAVVAVGETDAVIFEEIGRAPAAGGRQGRLRRDGVAFEEGRTAVDGGQGAGAQLAGQHAQPPEGAGGPGLHLRDVAGLVDRQLGGPGRRLGREGLGHGEQLQPARGPGDLPVGQGRAGVQHDGHLVGIRGVGPDADAPGHGPRPALQRRGVGAAERIQPAGVDDVVVCRVYVIPSDPRRLAAHRVELGCRREGRKKEAQRKCN